MVAQGANLADDSSATRGLRIKLSVTGGVTDEAVRNRAALMQAYSRMVEGDFSLMDQLMDPGIRFRQAPSLPYGGEAVGPEAVRNAIGTLLDTWRYLEAEFLEFSCAGDIVIAYFMMNAVSRATGQAYRGPTTELFRFRAAKIIEWSPIYWDTHAARQACGMS